MFDFRQERNLLMFKPFPLRARFNLAQEESQAPSVVLAYPSEAFEKLKWFAYFLQGRVCPRIFLAEPQCSRFKAQVLIETARFPVTELAKNFGLQFVLARRIKEVHLIISSEISAKILDAKLFTEAFLGASQCELQFCEERAFDYLPSFRQNFCISMEAEIIFPKNS